MIERIFFAAMILLGTQNIFAQNSDNQNSDQLFNKKGKAMLPVAGEFGIGLNALPFVDLFGELIRFNSANRFINPLSFEAPDGQQLFLKYFRNSKTAYRARIGVAYHYNTESFPVADDYNTGFTTTDKRSENYTMIVTGIGLEKRKGLGRIQGIFGAELNLMYRNGTPTLMNYKYTYANPITAENTAPSTALFLDGTPRPLFEKTFSSIGMGATGFFGLEFFVAPKISLGGEMGLKLMYIYNTNSKTKTEAWGTAEGYIIERQTTIDQGGQFDASVNFNSNGVLFVMFYF
ncbi:MAG: hypothetical protein JXB00_14210 [Bacteroidales bacterium]|nr:hypothetical protein [Bacteroidales bacterium]